jgi:hypothetical protein
VGVGADAQRGRRTREGADDRWLVSYETRVLLAGGWFVLREKYCWLVADNWCWLVLREEYRWLVAGGWFVLREKYCCLVADKPREQGEGRPSFCLDFILFRSRDYYFSCV